MANKENLPKLFGMGMELPYDNQDIGHPIIEMIQEWTAKEVEKLGYLPSEKERKEIKVYIKNNQLHVECWVSHKHKINKNG